jgi:hypothetical protein
MNFLLKLLELIQKLVKSGMFTPVPNVDLNPTLNPTIPSLMNLTLKRKWINDSVAIGELSINDVFECYTLEGISVIIPPGTYPIEITYSPHFNRMLPLIDDVSGRDAIRIHPGNTVNDTEGCILVGKTHDQYDVYSSQEAFTFLFNKLTKANKIQITIS